MTFAATRTKASKSNSRTAVSAADRAWEKNRLKPGALFYISVDGEQYPMRYPTRRGKLPLSTSRQLVDSMVAPREKTAR